MSEGYCSDYDRDEYLAIERGEHASDPPAWMVRGAVKIRLLQTRPGTDEDDTDALVWLYFDWTHTDADPDRKNADESALEDALPEIAAAADALLRTDLGAGDIEDYVLEWEVDE